MSASSPMLHGHSDGSASHCSISLPILVVIFIVFAFSIALSFTTVFSVQSIAAEISGGPTARKGTGRLGPDATSRDGARAGDGQGQEGEQRDCCADRAESA
mmetsp:Transcript_8185/g.27479  ORF Transcript_8185/g.27479 Transcript_8185/m.27479 type:complete len:101 (+) Transcript_8185:222-524(+)